MNAPHLIALYSPSPQSGKTSIANHLIANHGFTRISLAGPLKTVARTFLRQFGFSTAECIRLTESAKEEPLPELGNLTTRHLLQTLGTDWGRRCLHPDIWIQCWEAQYRQHLSQAIPDDLPISDRTPLPRVVVDDVRFPNEADLIRRYSGQMWEVHRPSALTDPAVIAHASEGGLTTYPYFDTCLFNDGTLPELLELVDSKLSPPITCTLRLG